MRNVDLMFASIRVLLTPSISFSFILACRTTTRTAADRIISHCNSKTHIYCIAQRNGLQEKHRIEYIHLTVALHRIRRQEKYRITFVAIALSLLLSASQSSPTSTPSSLACYFSATRQLWSVVHSIPLRSAALYKVLQARNALQE
jgi:hypothetical protein